MNSTIQIKFLSLDEMANARDIDWRYENVGIDNLGFADKAKNRVFVRAGLEQQLQNILIDHELNHLFELEGTDEDEHGIRHKKKKGFMSWFLPVILAIGGALIGGPAGSAIGSSLGSALGIGGGALASGVGTALGTGAGTMLGGATGSSLTGKPEWGQNAISGAGAAAGSAAGQWLGSLGTSTTGNASSGFSGVVGNPYGAGTVAGTNVGGISGATGQAMRYGTPWLGSSLSNFGGELVKGGTETGLGMLAGGGVGGYSPTSYSGQSDQAAGVPDIGTNYGASGMQTSSGVGGTAGLSKMPMNIGLGQAGIALSGQSPSGSGQQVPQQGQGFNDMFPGMEQDPIGYNFSNGGQLAF